MLDVVRLKADKIVLAVLGTNPEQVTALDRLAALGARTMGALTFHPAKPLAWLADVRIDLGRAAANAEDVIEVRASEVLPALIVGGSSPGGARPKVVVGIREGHEGSWNPEIIAGPELVGPDYTPIIAKFNAPVDAPDAGRVEVAYAEMARAAGLSVARVRLLMAQDPKRGNEQAFFATNRFDRGPGGTRVHVHTVSGYCTFRLVTPQWSTTNS